MAYAEDTNGRRQYTVRIKDLATGELLPDVVTGVSANLMWGDDGRTLYFVENDPTTLLTKRVKAHVLGGDVAKAKLVYEEADETFYMGIGRTRSDDYLCISVSSTVSSEMRCTEADAPVKKNPLSTIQTAPCIDAGREASVSAGRSFIGRANSHRMGTSD